MSTHMRRFEDLYASYQFRQSKDAYDLNLKQSQNQQQYQNQNYQQGYQGGNGNDYYNR